MVAFATPGVSRVCKRSTKRDPLEEAREEKAFGLWKEAKMALHFFFFLSSDPGLPPREREKD
jgi:hypothetical protein